MRINKFNMFWRIYLCAFVLSTIAGLSSFAQEDWEKKAAKGFIVPYQSMTLADWLVDQGMIDEAIELYTEAFTMFQALSNEYPAWQPELLKFRISYCRNKLKGLRATGLPQAKVSTPPHTLLQPESAKAVPTTGFLRQIEEEDPYAEIIHTALETERAGALAHALDLYTAILDQSPGQKEAIKGSLRCSLRMTNLEQAKSVLQQIGHISDSDPDLIVLMAIVECYYQQYDRALQLLKLSLEKDPLNAVAHAVIGIVFMRMGNIKEAQDQMKQALSINSKMHEAYYNLAWICLKKNPADIPIARFHYQNALKYGAESDPVLDTLLH